MKTIFLTILVYFFSVQFSQAQWQPDVRLTNNPSPSNTSLNNAWCVASSGDTVIAVWDDQRDGNFEIYYKRSTDAGLTWGADTRLTNTVFSYDPCVTISGLVVHVVWQELRDGYYEIYYKRSTDGGVSWDADTRLTTNTSDSFNPSISVNGSVVHVVWEDERQGNSEVYYKGSTDGGVTWGADTRLTTDPADSWNPSVAVSGSVIHVAWYDNRNGSGNWEIYYKRSTDGGVSWGDETRMTNNSHVSRYPCIAVSGSIVHLVWHDDRDGNYDIYYKRSTDGGTTWSADTRLTVDTGHSMFPCVAVSGSTVHVVWIDSRNTPNVEIYYKRSTDGGLSWETDVQLTSASLSVYPSVAVSGSVVHVIWQDNRDGNNEIYYKRNPSGNPTDVENLNSEVPQEFSLEQNYPNPFNPSTAINYQIPVTSQVMLKVFDVLGNEIATLVNEEKQAGSYEVNFNASNLSSGIYLYKLNAGNLFETKKMILLR